MLTGMNKNRPDFFSAVALAEKRCDLHEVRPGAGDKENFHRCDLCTNKNKPTPPVCASKEPAAFLISLGIHTQRLAAWGFSVNSGKAPSPKARVIGE